MSAWLGIMDGVDRRLLHYLVLRRSPAAGRFFLFVTRFGDPVPLGLFALLLLIREWVTGPDPAGVGFAMTAGLALAFLASQILKRRISRPRPTLPTGFGTLVRAPDRFSFPSGHAAATLAIALPPARELASAGFPLAASVLLVPALLVGVSRVWLGVHYPGDVVAGWALALGASILVAVVQA